MSIYSALLRVLFGTPAERDAHAYRRRVRERHLVDFKGTNTYCSAASGSFCRRDVRCDGGNCTKHCNALCQCAGKYELVHVDLSFLK